MILYKPSILYIHSKKQKNIVDQHFTYTFQTFRKVSKYVILQMEGWSVRYSRQSQQDKKQSDVPCFHLVILVYKIQTSLPLIWEWLFLKFRVRCFPCSCSNLLGVFWLDCVWSCCPPRFCFLAPQRRDFGSLLKALIQIVAPRRLWIWTSSTARLLSGSPKRRTMSDGLSFPPPVSLFL